MHAWHTQNMREAHIRAHTYKYTSADCCPDDWLWCHHRKPLFWERFIRLWPKPSLSCNTPLAAPYGWVLKPRVEGLMTERMCSAHAEGCWGDGLKKTLIKSLAWKGCTRSAVRRGQGKRSQTHVYNKRQVTRAKLCMWKIQECTIKYFFFPI